MAIYNREYLLEVYNKYKYLYNEDDEDEDDTEDDEEEYNEQRNPRKDNKSKKGEEKKSPTMTSSNDKNTHLSKQEVRRAVTLITNVLSDYTRMKKCCDYVDLEYRDHINDDGKRESPFEGYYNDNGNAYLELLDGDVFSGYPDFKATDRDKYDKDEKEFVRDVNELFKRRGIEAKFMVNPNKDDEAIGFGIRSCKK